jgi:HAD superfamily hydrolase (TIGR01509 family)
MKPCRAFIFDMDGVIVDSEPLHEQAFLELFAELGWAESHGVDFPAYFGRSDESLLADVLARHLGGPPLSELLGRKRQRLIRLIHERRPLFDGLPELLRALHPRYPLAIASGSPHPVIQAVLGLADLRPCFSALVSAQDVAREKPAPDIFLRAADLLGIPAADCCVIEDSAAGVQGARAAGMTVVAVTHSLEAHQLPGADYIVHSCAELRQLLIPVQSALASGAGLG